MRKQIIYDLADRLMDISAAAGVAYTGTMVSNGFLMTRDVAEKLFINGLRTVQITLDGSQPFHDARRHLLSESKKGTYQRIVQNIASWIDVVPISVAFATSLLRNNQVRIVAVASPQRLPGDLADVPTWRELGQDGVGLGGGGLERLAIRATDGRKVSFDDVAA